MAENVLSQIYDFVIYLLNTIKITYINIFKFKFVILGTSFVGARAFLVFGGSQSTVEKSAGTHTELIFSSRGNFERNRGCESLIFNCCEIRFSTPSEKISNLRFS